MRTTGLAALLALALLAAPRLAAADNIVFVDRSGQIARIDPDRPGARVVVPAAQNVPWEGISQADDGTIVAMRGERIYRFSPKGRFVNRLETAVSSAPARSRPSTIGPWDPEISPDGRFVAYWWAYNFQLVLPTLLDGLGDLTSSLRPGRLLPELLFSYSIARIEAPGHFEDGDIGGGWPSWYGNSRILLGNHRRPLLLYELLDNRKRKLAWFQDDGGMRHFLVPRLSRNGKWLAVIQAPQLAVSQRRAPRTMRIYRMNGDAPKLPRGSCAVAPRARIFSEVSWSPDGTRLAWADGRGIWIARAPERLEGFDRPCVFSTPPRLVVPGGAEPHWGPSPLL